MCTVILLYGLVPTHPIVLAGNRDEFHARRSRPPRPWDLPGPEEPVRILAGRDEQDGGTWFGVNQHGLVVGLTNRYTGARTTDRMSRGGLVLRCLSQQKAGWVAQNISDRDSEMYNPYNLFAVSADSGFACTNYPAPSSQPISSGGVYVFTNRQLGDPQDPKTAWIRASFHGLPLRLKTVQEHLLGLLQSHGATGSPEPLCVHLSGYGTVSSYFLAIGQRHEESRFLNCEGPPCENPYQDLTPRLLDLLRPAVTRGGKTTAPGAKKG